MSENIKIEYKEKIKIVTIGDHPLSPSGVGTQTKYVCEALLKSGRFEILSLGGSNTPLRMS